MKSTPQRAQIDSAPRRVLMNFFNPKGENNMLNKIKAFIDAHESEMLADAMALIRIDSERTEPKPGMPFGEGAAHAMAAGLEILTRHGFAPRNFDNYVITADLNSCDPCLDILAHLDVVPAGEGWSVTGPFDPVVKDGMLYGRGSADDKGPAIAALYAMLAVRELGIPLKGNCRLILGSDEECGSSDIRYYYSQVKPAPMTFSPDADFPLINIEKGGMHMAMKAADAPGTEGIRLVSAQSGTKINVVPGEASAVIAGADMAALADAARSAEEATGAHFTLSEEADGIHVLAVGTFAHAASPEMGNNALTAMLTFLASVPFADADTCRILSAFHRFYPHGDYHGSALGVDHEDAESGKLTLSLDLFRFDGKEFSAMFDCRAPICANDANTAQPVRAQLEAAGFTVEGGNMFAPHHVPADSDFVQTLLGCYETVTGKPGKAIAMGGGTYVHHLDSGVAFGCADPAVDNRMHGPDEFMSVAQMKMSAVIFALSIARLCGADSADNAC